MGNVREFIKSDIPQVVDLRQKCFRLSEHDSKRELQVYFEQIFFDNPWYDETLPSLVYQENDDQISGFLGIVPRRMSMQGQPVHVAVSTQFMVEPSSRSSLAAAQLLKTFFLGPQDLSIADVANDAARKLWERLGGTSALSQRMYWTRPLRPSRYGIDCLRRRGLPAYMTVVSKPVCYAIDAITARTSLNPFRIVEPQVSEQELTVETLLTCLSEHLDRRLLRPQYTRHELQWLLDRVAQKQHYGTLQKRVLRNAGGHVVGWYLYFAKPGGTSEVLQISAQNNHMPDVLDHLFYHAWKQGAVRLSGHLDPRFMPALSAKGCFFNCEGPWLLIHSHNPDLLQAHYRGDMFFTRLEGEWWLSF